VKSVGNAPPPELVQPLPPPPAIPAEINEATTAGYIVDLRAALRDVTVRFDALRQWAMGQH
jgi:hypothetical protein